MLLKRGVVCRRGSAGAVVRSTWTGTLVVPGLEFDVTPPTLSGATSKLCVLQEVQRESASPTR